MRESETESSYLETEINESGVNGAKGVREWVSAEYSFYVFSAPIPCIHYSALSLSLLFSIFYYIITESCV